ncbi:MAG TPA: type III-B CRISPR module RAMP protein Cmr1, partial [Myxococcota bacterium]|nr:type III-B CRISPR module RAMP protein Cmr1 [Myxococcota bacterium]
MVGGGSEAMVPDAAAPVRVPAIRGVWRWWWRALQPLDKGEIFDVQVLKAREQLLFGGVKAPGLDLSGSDLRAVEGEEDARGSLFRLHVKVTSKRLAAAGQHRLTERGLRVLPDWNVPQALGYALFPLQRPAADRVKWRANGPMPTADLVMELDFQLEVLVDERRWQGFVTEQQSLAERRARKEASPTMAAAELEALV